MSKYIQFYSTHMAIQDSISTIKLLGIMDPKTVPEIRVKNNSPSRNACKTVTMSVRSIFMDIIIPSLDRPLFVIIAVTSDGGFKRVFPVRVE